MAKKGKDENKLEAWILKWFYSTAVICTYDATFCVFRPYTLPDGPLHAPWYPYRIYMKVDQRYKDTNDSFSFTVSLLNYVEVILNIITIVLHYRNNRYTKILAYTVCVLTFWKTVLYLLMYLELAGGKDFRRGNTPLQEFFVVLIPNGLWIVVPAACIYYLWKDLSGKTRSVENKDDGNDTPLEGGRGYDLRKRK
ncbi:hypothetical protein CHS0354_040072 [Potamilus streckersoni]|uniref:Emopamil-binding protein n=1 Tax=Potamilus streckersoni TaxID=2493646 RepID=A0AAE0ST96_9BIVA|nr:hypothetical protein CHS0354_040072 [Potamilus streckersoni]